MSRPALLTRARESRARLLLAAADPAALTAAAETLARADLDCVLAVGDGGIVPESDPRLRAVADLLRSGAPERIRDGIHALDLAADPLRFAAGLLALGEADALLAGPGTKLEALADLARWTLGLPVAGTPVAGVVWLVGADGSLVACADCGFAGGLDQSGRAGLAGAVGALHTRIAGEPPRVAQVGADTPPRFRDRANVLIFPDGTAGLLAARTARVVGGARMLGPLLLGPPRVMTAVVEDAEAEELVGTAAAAMLAAARAGT
ncbi:MAG TPA: phosphate acyltransferase [Gemmatimonadales bacterium]|nr:phosphate acyltransferase [Gemmatimonadales bacterium]